MLRPSSSALAVLTSFAAGALIAACSEERASPPVVERRRGADAAAGEGDAEGTGDAEQPIDGGAIDGATGADGAPDPEDAGGAPHDGATRLDARPGQDASTSDGGGDCGYTAAVTGRVCSPAQRDWVPGATVTLEAVDCHGRTIVLTTTTGPDGSFHLEGVPPGQWLVTAVAGAFSETYTVDVIDGRETLIPIDSLCVRQDVVRVAVVTGFGDRIETLLTNLGIRFDPYDGNSRYATEASVFLSDLSRLMMYDLVFIDCAAATTISTVEIGANATQIVDNLRQYVLSGGSLYASDWAVTFLALAFPQEVQPQLRSGAMVTLPFDATRLMGYAPQTVTATIVDGNLARAIGVTRVLINFPDAPGARSANWGLLDLAGTHARILVEGHAQTCMAGAQYCDVRSPAGPVVSAPLAIAFKLTPPTERGGNVFYTAFHNIAQMGNGVSDILRYIVFHL